MGVPRRAVQQILIGLLPLLAICAVCLVLLSMRLSDTGAPLRAATERAEAEVVATGLGSAGLQLGVEYVDADGQTQAARLTLEGTTDIPLGTTFEVSYDPELPGVVYANGDAASSAYKDILNGLFLIGLVAIVGLAVTLVRLFGRRRLGRREARQLPVHHERYRRGITDRSWLVVHSGESRTWVPVYWDGPLEQIGESPQPTAVYGDPERNALLGFDIYGEPIWPSGRRRARAPKGHLRELDAAPGEASLLRQVRTDILGLFGAPLFGVLWAYIDGSGPAGFVFATAVSAGVLFWLPSVYGSDPT